MVNEKSIFRQSLFLVMILMLCGCGVIVQTLDEINLLSDEEEVQLGDEVVKEIEAKEKVLNEPVATAYIRQMGQRIAPNLPQRSFGYTFKLLEGDEINAFATPGGHCYVYTGLIKFAENESQLAGVMAHECAHVAREHIGRQLTKMYALQTLGQAVLGEDPSTVESIAISLVGTGVGLKYSRLQEFEADRFGCEAMYHTGFNPHGMIEFFENLEEKYGSGPSGITKYMSTHPPTSERMARLHEQIATYEITDSLVVDTEEFHRIKGSLP